MSSPRGSLQPLRPDLLPPLPHVRVHSQCGACGHPFAVGDKLVVLLGSINASTTPGQKQVPYTFPGNICSHHHRRRDSEVLLCPFVYCRRCEEGEESATIHTDCLSLYLNECPIQDTSQKLLKLWTVSTWRYPWRNALPLYLLPARDEIGDMALASRFVPGLDRLPPELVSLVWDCTRPDMLARYNAVLKLSRHLVLHPQETTVTVPLCNIYSWDRGLRPIIQERIREPMIRLTMDAGGLKRIERISEPNQGRTEIPHGQAVYIVEQAERFAEAFANFKLGLCRLTIPKETEFYLWDTSNPPDPADCFSPTLAVPRHTRFASIDTRKCTGLTFFISSGATRGIHAHTLQAPCAMETYQKIPPMYSDDVSWVYVPLDPDDSIIAFGVRLSLRPMTLGSLARQPTPRFIRTMPCYLIRLERSGDLAIGPHHTGETQDFVSTTVPRPIIVHDVPLTPTIYTASAYPKREDNVEMRTFSPADSPPYVEACLSSARLEDVICTRVFYDPDTYFCRGIILSYRDGTQRAVGQCRLGVDPHRDYSEPSTLCYLVCTEWRSDRSLIENIKVEFATSPRDEHGHGGKAEWSCVPMRGTLQLWFYYLQTRLLIVSD